jgi:ABC-2 type transport system ATP-binding protein
VSALLGPNGAGKTTTIAILSTLLAPDAGRAVVQGHDVVREAAQVRYEIGLSGQFAAVDEGLTGWENLDLFGRLHHLDRPTARRRADELIERFGLGEVARRPVKGYSGGTRRRLDVAASLVAAPPVLFLDEPTTGLDPASRSAVWELIGDLVRGGTTVLLTTQYLEEADRLSDSVVVIDHGRVIARGTVDELKERVGGWRLELVVRDPADLPRAVEALRAVGLDAEPDVQEKRGYLGMPVTRPPEVLGAVVDKLAEAGVAVEGLGIGRPTLDDAFLMLTGHRTGEGADAPPGAPPEPVTASTRGQDR